MSDILVKKIADEIEKNLNQAKAKELFSDLIEELKRRQEKASTETKIISAVELDPVQKKKIENKLESRKIVYVVNKEILGGLIIEKDGKRQDMSLRKRLNLVKKVISE